MRLNKYAEYPIHAHDDLNMMMPVFRKPFLYQVWQKTTKSAVSGRSAKIGDLLKNTGASIVSGEGSTPGKRALANAEMMHQVDYRSNSRGAVWSCMSMSACPPN